MSLFSWLSRDKSVTTDVLGKIGAIGEYIGNLNLTDEELVKHNAKTVESVQQFVKDTLSESTERSKSRREIAHDFTRFYLLWCSVSFGIWPIDSDYAVFIITALTGLALGGAFTAIMIFYFGSHGLNQMRGKKE